MNVSNLREVTNIFQKHFPLLVIALYITFVVQSAQITLMSCVNRVALGHPVHLCSLIKTVCGFDTGKRDNPCHVA